MLGDSRESTETKFSSELRDLARPPWGQFTQIRLSGEDAGKPVIGLAEISQNGPDEVLEIGDPHVNHIPVRTGIKGNELLLGHFPVQIDRRYSQPDAVQTRYKCAISKKRSIVSCWDSRSERAL
jgi:hypothetical protein